MGANAGRLFTTYLNVRLSVRNILCLWQLINNWYFHIVEKMSERLQVQTLFCSLHQWRCKKSNWWENIERWNCNSTLLTIKYKKSNIDKTTKVSETILRNDTGVNAKRFYLHLYSISLRPVFAFTHQTYLSINSPTFFIFWIVTGQHEPNNK